MSAVAFLLIAVVITVCGSAVLYIRQRPSTSVDSGVETFRRGLDALEGARRAQARRQPGSDGRDSRGEPAADAYGAMSPSRPRTRPQERREP